MNEKNNHRLRLSLLSIFFIAILIVIVYRMVSLTILDRQFLQNQGNARSLRTIETPAFRGMITDRNGAPLAISTSMDSVWINPKNFVWDDIKSTQFLRLLNIPATKFKKNLTEAQGREFLYVKRLVAPNIISKIKALKLPGVHFKQEYKRFYPQGDSTAQLIGFTDVDDMGIEGLEFAYNQWLEGKSGKKRVVKDRQGRIIEELDTISEPRAGHDLHLSIDRRIQFAAYQELQKTLAKYNGKAGSAVVIDTQNGEVLAIANAPSFNPNARGHYDFQTYRNKAMIDLFEPGSVMKPFSIASALASGKFKPDTTIDTNPSWMVVQGKTIRDVHNYGRLDVTGVLEHSSNVGVTKMLLQNPPEQLIHLLEAVGIGRRTNSAYPGESEGTLTDVSRAKPFVLATMGFGYGMSVTAMQLAQSYLIFANNGSMLPIRLLHLNEPEKKYPVISAKVATDVLAMMESVIEEGTGRKAQVAGFRVAGKTGTARIAGKSGYQANRHIASFVGIAPVSNPRLIVCVVIHEPRKISYYGGQVAAPLFANIMQASLQILNIKSDKELNG